MQNLLFQRMNRFRSLQAQCGILIYRLWNLVFNLIFHTYNLGLQFAALTFLERKQSLEELVEEKELQLRDIEFLLNIIYMGAGLRVISKETVEFLHTLKYTLELLRKLCYSCLLPLDFQMELLSIRLAGESRQLLIHQDRIENCEEGVKRRGALLDGHTLNYLS